MNDKCVWMTRDECSHDQPTNDFNDFNLHTFTLNCFVLSMFQCEFVRVSSCCCCCLHLTAAIRFLSTSFFMVDISAISAEDTQRQIYISVFVLHFLNSPNRRNCISETRDNYRTQSALVGVVTRELISFWVDCFGTSKPPLTIRLYKFSIVAMHTIDSRRRRRRETKRTPKKKKKCQPTTL